MPAGKRSSKSKPQKSLTPTQKTSFESFFSTNDLSLWRAKNIMRFFRKFNFRINDKDLACHAIEFTKEQLQRIQLDKEGLRSEDVGGDEHIRKERALREMLDRLRKLKKHLSFKTPPKRGIQGPIPGTVFNVCTGGNQTNYNAADSPALASDCSFSSDISQPDTFSVHFHNMCNKFPLGDKYLEDLIYNALKNESIDSEKEVWLLESSMVNFDYLNWLDDPMRTKLQKFRPTSPQTHEAIIASEAYLAPFWETTNFEEDMPPLVPKTPWGKSEDYIFYHYYHLFVHYWYNFIPVIGVDPSRGYEPWLSRHVYNHLFAIFQSPFVSLRPGETASIHSPDYRFDGIFSWNNIEFGALEIAPEGTQSSHQAKVDKDCYKLYQVVGKMYNKLNAITNSKVPHPAVGIMCRGFSFTIIKVSQLNKNLLQTSHHEFLLPTSTKNICQLKGILHSIGILYNMLNGNRQFVQDKLRLNEEL